MRSLEDIQNDNQKREEEVRAKEARYVERRKFMNIKLAIGGAVLALAGNLFYSYLAGFLILLFALPLAAVAGFLIGRLGLGRLLSMPVYALSQGVAMSFFYGVMAMMDTVGQGGHAEAIGSGIILFFTIAGYGVLGAILGLCNEIFDRNHLQI